MGDGYGFSPEILKRVWGEILPIASDDYDNAIERLFTTSTMVMDSHLMTMIDDAWLGAVSGAGTSTVQMLREMQQTILATADAVKFAMEQYVAVDEESSDRLEAAHDNAEQMTGVHDVEGQP